MTDGDPIVGPDAGPNAGSADAAGAVAWRWGLVGAIAGYLVGIVIAVPIAAMVWGEATTTPEHRVDLWGVAFWGGVVGAALGAALGVLRARAVGSGPTDAGEARAR